MYDGWSRQLDSLLNDEPTVGALVDLCEENYFHLLRLAPGLSALCGRHHSVAHGHADLHLAVIEQSAYTTLIHLTHYFHHDADHQPDPDALLRVYHDAHQVEVLNLNQCVLPTMTLYQAPGLRNKWRANLFIAKWLGFCVRQGHRFDVSTICRNESAISD